MAHNFEPIAVVGLGCRMPGDVECLDDFQRVMESGHDVISEVPPDRWDLDKYWHPDPHHIGTHANRRAGFMKNVHDFDHTFFNTSPREAANTDVQQRQLLEVTQEAIDDAGIPSESLPRNTGVYIGIGLMDMGFTVIEDAKCMNAYTHTGTGHSVAANRISYFYDIRGPSVAIDTACAASLTSMHYACFGLWNKECPIAIVGGCNTLMVPEVTVGFSALGVLAPDGKSCPFSAKAQGYVRSEGIGVVILEPLSKALANNHHVHCVIKGSWLGHNGYSLSITMPSTDAQADLMRETYSMFNLSMDDIDFVEAHGTGTPVGDPIEAEAIAQAFAIGNPNRKEPLLVGSGKSHFGHLECAAGMNQIVKIVLMLKNKIIYPNINFEIENPKIDCKTWNIKIPEEAVPYTRKDKKFQVGVNTFGFGGALAHMIFEEYTPEVKQEITQGQAGWKFGSSAVKGLKILIPLSAKSSSALKETAAKWLDFSNEYDAQEVACWMATHRSQYSNRLCIMANSGEDFRSKLQLYTDKSPHDEIVEGTLPVHKEEYSICFVFPGQGQQSFNMGRTLYREEPIFRAAVDSCDAIYTSLAGHSFLQHTKLFIPLDDIKDYDETIVDEIHISQPAILFLQVGMFKLLEYWGVNPNVVIGHSLGEVAASYASGALTLQEAVTVQYNRAQQQAKVAGSGAMAALRVTPEEGWELCKNFDDLYVACINAPESITLAGGNKDIAKLCNEYPEQAKQIRVKCAFHTCHMDSLSKEFLASMEGKLSNMKPSKMTMYSTVTGNKFEEPCDAKYCWDNIREQVKFSPAVEGILEDYKNVVFVELAGSATLLGCIRQTCKYVNEQPAALIPCGQRQKDDRMTMLRAVSSLHTMGVQINWNNMLGNCAKYMTLPRYAWQHSTFRYEAEGQRSRRLDLEDLTYKGLHGQIKLESLLFLKDHIINGKLLFPKSGFVEYIIQSTFEADELPQLENIRLSRNALEIPEEIDLNGEIPERRNLKLLEVLTTRGKEFSVSSDSVDYASATRKCIARSHAETVYKNVPKISIEAVKERCAKYHDSDSIYDALTQLKVQYEDTRKFKHINEFYLGDGESIAFLQPVVDKRERIQTVTLDSVLLSALATRPMDLPYEIIAIKNIDMTVPKFTYKQQLCIISKVVQCDAVSLLVDATVCNLEGVVLATIQGICAEFNDVFDSPLQNIYQTIEQPLSASLPDIDVARQMFSAGYLQKHHPYDLAAIEKAEPLLPRVKQICAMYAKYGVSHCTPEELHPKMERYYGRLQQMSKECFIDNLTLDHISKDVDYVKEKSPEMTLEMEMIRRMGSILPEMLKDPRVGLTELFQEDMMGAYFIDSITTRIHYKMIGDIVKKTTEYAAQNKKILRVLEIGGRLGGLTRHIVDSINKQINDFTVDYTFSDINITFFDMVRDKFTDFPMLKYQQFDPESDGISQNFSPHSFDLVVCLDTLHCTENALSALSNIKELVAEDGWLIVMESTFNHNTPEIIFGVFDLCWIFEDDREDRCWMSQSGWVDAFNEAGFEDSCALSTPNEFFHSLIIGRNKISMNNEVANIEGDLLFQYVLLKESSNTVQDLSLKNIIELTTEEFLKLEDGGATDVIYCIDADVSVKKLYRIINTCEAKEIRTLWILIDDKTKSSKAALLRGLLNVLANEKKDAINIYHFYLSDSSYDAITTIMKSRTNSDRGISLRNNTLFTKRMVKLTATEYKPSDPDCWKLVSTVEDNKIHHQLHEVDSHLMYPGVHVKLSAFSGCLPITTNLDLPLCAVGTITDGIYLDKSEDVLVIRLQHITPNITLPFTHCIKKPAHMSSEQSVSSALPYTLANYCLHVKLAMTNNDSVLIINACSPIGMATTILAQLQTRDVFCFVENEEQRKFMVTRYNVKQCFIFNADVKPQFGFMKDVTHIVNCHKSFDYSLLREMQSGCHLFNITNNNSDMQHIPNDLLTYNVSVHTVQLDLLFNEERFVEDVRNAMELVSEKRLPHIPYRSLSVVELMQSPGNTAAPCYGNEIITLTNPADLYPCIPKSNVFNSKASYVIVGEMSDVVLELATWVYQRGGRFLILLSSTRPTTWLEKSTVTLLEKSGMIIKVLECDTKNKATLSSLMQSITQNGIPPVKGIFSFTQVDPFASIDCLESTEIYDMVMDKVVSTLNMSQIVSKLNIDLDHFVVFTSASSSWSCPGLAVQSAADGILEQLVKDRRAAGLPGICFQVGWVKGLKWQRTTTSDQGAIIEKAIKPISSQFNIRDVFSILHEILSRKDLPPVVCASLEDWNAAYDLVVKDSLLFKHLVSPDGGRKTDCNLSREDLELKVVEKLGNLLMMPAEEIDQSQPMVHYGVDSLISLDVTNWMRKEFNLQVNQMDILEGMTTETLIEQALG